MELTLKEQLSTSQTNEIEKVQRNFLESDFGKIINTTIDVGIKAALPDLLEDQIIQIKDTILEQGLQEGIKEVVRSGIDLGKSAIGIFTGNFESIEQVQMAVKKGGILDGVSELLDAAIRLASKKNLIPNSVSTILKQSKNTIISSISNKIEESLTNQLKAVEKLENYCKKWEVHYGNQDFTKMQSSYRNIEKYLDKIMPLENIIKKARSIENIHNLIKNNGKDFHLSQEEKLLADTLVVS